MTEKQFAETNINNLTDKMFAKIEAYYNRKLEAVAHQTFPVLRDVLKERGDQIENIVVPFTDGVRSVQVATNLKKAVESNGYEGNIPSQDPGQVREARPQQRQDMSKLKVSKPELAQTANGMPVDDTRLERQAAYTEQAKFKVRYPGYNTYISYVQPNYRLRVGDFRTKLEAEKFMNELKKNDNSSMMLKDKVTLLANQIHAETVANRRHLHAHPELSFHEYETSAFVAKKLDELGIEYKKMANTGLVALIKGSKPSNAVVALRADMDALPIVEANEVEYKSQNHGVMHACGHDVHTSSLLGTAKILSELKDEFGGTPAEEKLPGGANLMIQEGVLENPKPDAVLGQHVMPLIEAGKVGFRSGKYMASTDEIYVTVHGKGGHGAQPQQNIDPVLITSHIIVALQQIISRVADPKTPSVLSFGKVIANGATNVIPNEVYLEGTFRTMDEEWRAKAHEKMKKMAEGIAEAMGGSCDLIL
ncbi:putative thermostable carboxypeptidase 2-like [Daphnia sinensis]|uniref:Thermostable carboxypeptidase 2-like n=1 Tax=Daphnia sinensis TaxID=1820382 RepID=A0AAD5L2Z4_9CRUS|nr:putative thermostable carboxypeptidase 2-like [Daphnia sinensis]